MRSLILFLLLAVTSFGGTVITQPGGDFVKIASVTLSSSAASISFTSIPQTFTHLKIVASVRNTGDGADVFGTFNGDSADANYARTYWYITGNGTSTSPGAFIARSEDSSVADTYAPSEAMILDYTGGHKKSVIERLGFALSQIQNNYTVWSGTAAITSIVLTPQSGQFASGTVVSLYGLK